jgi:uracil-DNA glycosylase
VTDSRRVRLDTVLAAYQKIPILAELAFRSPLVPPSGSLISPIAIVGEAPGADEVIKGEPFVGRAGKHLQKLLQRAGVPWDWLYVTNVIPYRPPGNRTPYPFEVMASQQRLLAELSIVEPVVVISLGATAWNAFGQPAGKFSLARGKWHKLAYDIALPPADLLVTWHPAAALRDRVSDRELAEHLMTILRNNDADSDRGASSGSGAA